jgi:hypothetical protein
VRSWLHSTRVAVRGPFLYISSAKLNSMSPTRRWWRRISGFTAGVPGGSLGVTLDPADSAWPTRIEQIDRRLTSEQRVKSAHDAAFGPAGGLFRFDGNAAVLAALGTYWVATVTDDAAILLAGSLKHVIGAVSPGNEQLMNAVPVSADPRTTMKELAAGEDVGDQVAPYTWWAIVKQETETSRFEDLSHVSGIADYRSRARLDAVAAAQLAELAGLERPVEVVVVGSPLWIESG